MINLTSILDKNSIKDLISFYGTKITSSDIKGYCASRSLSYQTITKKLEPFKTSRGCWNLEVTPEQIESLEKLYNDAPMDVPGSIKILDADQDNLIPRKDPNFVAFGNFSDIKKVIKSNLFYPTFITGLSGNGKTFSVEQACAQLHREIIRVNITVETDADDLLGGFRMIAGETVWSNGPVVEAMQRGAILLLDETDLASNKILCLQSVLEGKGVYLKKINKFIQHSDGFNIFATANTKGKGSEDGRFIGTNVLNEAFLERFSITLEQQYPSTTIEQKILKKFVPEDSGDEALIFSQKLVDWADIIRKTFYDGGIDEIISTRRLVHIMKAYSIFGNKEKAIKICINRFDQETKESFLSLYDKIDADFNLSSDQTPELENPTPDIPF